MTGSVRPSLASLPATFDLVVVGAGITGAGVFREAVRAGARVLLVDAGDYAGGTSAWSSKLIHGGLRYLKQGQWRLTRESVQERGRLLEEAGGLVEPLSFVMPLYRGRPPGRLMMQAGLWIYDRMAGRHQSGFWSAADAADREPALTHPDLAGAVHYQDAVTDDARLVLRLIFDAVADGGHARNYTQAAIRRDAGRVIGVGLTDADTGETREIQAAVTVLAVGHAASAEDGAPRLRPLRGSHLVFPAQRLPVRQALSWLHPQDQRPVFAIPWLGSVVVGTTDLDHVADGEPPRMSAAEADYLLAGLRAAVPSRRLRLADATASYAGVRPVVDRGKADPSAESRESALWSVPGLVGATGGKLTTFRITARQILTQVARQLPGLSLSSDRRLFDGAAPVASQRGLYGRLGPAAAGRLLQDTPGDERATIGPTPFTWAELRWAARHEQVVRLEDLMLRRTRLGLLLADGGAAELPRILAIAAQELGWDAEACEQARITYLRHWQQCHDPRAAM